MSGGEGRVRVERKLTTGTLSEWPARNHLGLAVVASRCTATASTPTASCATSSSSPTPRVLREQTRFLEGARAGSEQAVIHRPLAELTGLISGALRKQGRGASASAPCDPWLHLHSLALDLANRHARPEHHPRLAIWSQPSPTIPTRTRLDRRAQRRTHRRRLPRARPPARCNARATRTSCTGRWTARGASHGG